MATGTTVLMPAMFTITVDSIDVTAQISEATIKFDANTTTIRTLTGSTDLDTDEKSTLTLAGYQDWHAPEAESVCWALWNAAGLQCAFSLEGMAPDGSTVTASGTLQARRPTFGPTADDAAKFSIDIPVVGIPAIALTPGLPLS